MLFVYLVLHAIAFSSLVVALAPPHIDWEDFESAHKMRRRLGISYNYTPVHMSAEHCRYLTEEECEHEDNIYAAAKDHRKLNPVIGEFNILALLMYFPETSSNRGQFPDVAYFDTMLNGGGPNDATINPGGSMKDWLQFNSLDQYHTNFIIEDWTATAQSEATYAAGTSGKNGVLAIQEVFRSKLDALDAAGFDWSRFDADGDGILDGVVVFHSGIPAEMGPYACAPDPTDRIWSQAGPGQEQDGWVSADGSVILGGFTLSSVFSLPFCDTNDESQQVFTPTAMAIFTHEYGHTFNLVDLYDQDYDEGTFGPGGIGAFDIMSYAYGMNSNPTFPGYMGSYSRIMAGWLTPIEITEDGFYTIQPSDFTPQVYKISLPYPDLEYLLIENRYAFRWSSDWPGEGLAIYHVDDSIGLQEFRSYPGKPGWPADHYRISVLQKDGLYEIEKMENIGNAGDLWVKDDVLGPGPDTWPNTDSYQREQVQTGLTIRVTSDPGYYMEFEVSGFKPWTG